VLSVIDPINHSRTLRVRLMEYMKEIEVNDGQSAASLEGVKAAAEKADVAFHAYLDSPRLKGEEAEAEAYRQAFLAYRNQGIQPLIEAAEAGIRLDSGNACLMSFVLIAPMKSSWIKCWRSMKPTRKN